MGFLITMSGCVSIGHKEYLNPYNLSNGSHKYKIRFDDDYANNNKLNREAKKLYPYLFSKEKTALPLKISVNRNINTSGLWSMIIYFGSMGILPAWKETKSSYSVKYYILNDSNEMIYTSNIEYNTLIIQYISAYSPIASWVAPDSRNIPKFSEFFPDKQEIRDYYNKVEEDQFIHAIAKSINQADQKLLEKAYLERYSFDQKYPPPK